jgi:hypothetical protein
VLDYTLEETGMDLRAIFAAVAEDMKRQFSVLTAQHQHRGLKGSAREEVIREFLAGVLPANIDAS